MKANKSFGKYLADAQAKKLELNTKVKYGKILSECFCDYQETDADGKITILKSILLLLLALMSGEETVSVETRQI